MGIFDKGSRALMKLKRKDISKLVLEPGVPLLRIKPGTDLYEGDKHRGVVVKVTPTRTSALTVEYFRGAIWFHDIDLKRYNPDTGNINSGSVCVSINRFHGAAYELYLDKLRGLGVA